MFPPNPVTTNIPNQTVPMTPRERASAGARASGRRIAGQVDAAIPNLPGVGTIRAIDDPTAGPGLITNLREALSGAARRSPLATPGQISAMEGGIPRTDAFYGAIPGAPISGSELQSPIAAALGGPRPTGRTPSQGMGVPEATQISPSDPSGYSMSPDAMASARERMPTSPSDVLDPRPRWQQQMFPTPQNPQLVPSVDGGIRGSASVQPPAMPPAGSLSGSESGWRRQMFPPAPAAPASPVPANAIGPSDGAFNRQQGQPPMSMPPQLGNQTDFSSELSPQLAPRQPMQLGVPSAAGTATTVRDPRMVPGLEIAGATLTPEGILADRVGGLSMQPDPAFVQQQIEAARALGEQRFADSDVNQMQSGRIADITANRNMGQMAGGNYGDMDPARAAASAQAMYRGGGLGGASMGAREDAIEQALRAQPAGPSLQERTAGTRQEMQGMVAQALQGQGGQMNPQAGFEQNARMLQPGTTLRGTSADGTPMIVSRGSAGTKDDRSRAAQQETNQRIRQERMQRMQTAGQARMARNAAMQEAANNPTNSPFFRQLMMTNPGGAAAIMNAQGQNQFGQAKLAQDMAIAKQQFDIETQKLENMGVIGQAEAAERNARAETSLAEAAAIKQAGDPEQMKLQRQIRGMQDLLAADPDNPELQENYQRLLGMADQDQSAGAYKPLKPPKGSGPDADIADEDIKRRISKLSENDGLSGDQLYEALIASGVDNERLRRFSNDNDFGLRSDIGSLWSVLWGKSPDAIRKEQKPFNDIFGRYRK